MLNFKIPAALNTPRFRVIRSNLIYVVALILFIFLGVSFIPQRLLIYNTQREDLNSLNAQIEQQEKRLKAIESVNIQDLQQLLLALNTLYPQQEDQFSIYPALENLQVVTGLPFVKKSAPFAPGDNAQISANINATASTEQIRTFLQNYIYKSARLITLDSISLQQVKTDVNLWNVGLGISFHAKEVSAGTGALTEIDPAAITFAREVQSFFTSKGSNYSSISIKDEDIPLDYPIKKDPFNQ